MLKVKVYLPPYLKADKLNKSGYIELNRGATLADLFRILEIPAPLLTSRLCRVNYEKAALKTELNEGDIISFYSLITGG